MKSIIYCSIAIGLFYFMTACSPTAKRSSPVDLDHEFIGAFKHGKLSRLTDNPYSDLEPKWSPNGQRIAYAQQQESGFWNAAILTAADTSDIQIASADRKFFHSCWWSPDGNQLAISATEYKDDYSQPYNIYIYSINLSDLSQSPRRISSGPIDGSPCWTPDGKYISHVSNRNEHWNIWLTEIESGDSRQLTFSTGTDHSGRWSPDGSKMVFHSDRDGGSRLYLYELATNQVSSFTTDTSYYDQFPAWSPDGKYVIFNRFGTNPGADIWARSLSDGREFQLTDSDYNDRRPTMAPDGKKIACSSDRNGNWDVWILEHPGLP